MTSQTINLDLIPGGVPPIINVSQYDKGQTWIFNVYAAGQTFEIPSGSAVTIQGTKPDRTGFQYACTFLGSVVEAIETVQMTVLPGDVPAEIRITKDGELIGSKNIIIRVEPAALTDETQISETDLPLIEQALEDLPLVEAYKKEAEAWAAGTIDGQAVPSTAEQYHNNAKYYAENFVGYVTDAQYAALATLYDLT